MSKNDTNILVHWSYTESNRNYDVHLSEKKAITKEFYNVIHSDKYKYKEFSFGGVVDSMGDVEFKIEELDFIHDPKFNSL